MTRSKRGSPRVAEPLHLDYDKIEKPALEIMHQIQMDTIRNYQRGFKFVWPSLPVRVRNGLHMLLGQTGDDFEMDPQK